MMQLNLEQAVESTISFNVHVYRPTQLYCIDQTAQILFSNNELT